MIRRLCTDGRLAVSALALLVALASPACREAAAPTPVAILDAGLDPAPTADDSTETPDAGETDAGGAARPLSVEARALAEAFEVKLDRESRNDELPPGVRFELELPRLADVRVRLFDEADRVVASQDRLEIGTRTRYVLVPAEPLVTGSGYTLMVDGLRAELATDDDGGSYEIVRIELRTAGEKPPKEPPKKQRRSKRRR